jgi:hypothetical protein
VSESKLRQSRESKNVHTDWSLRGHILKGVDGWDKIISSLQWYRRSFFHNDSVTIYIHFIFSSCVLDLTETKSTIPTKLWIPSFDTSSCDTKDFSYFKKGIILVNTFIKKSTFNFPCVVYQIHTKHLPFAFVVIVSPHRTFVIDFEY